MAQIDNIKMRLNISDSTKDDLLNQLLDDAEAEMLDYTNRTELKASMLGIQRELVIVYYNRLGDEGINSRSEGGVSVSYSTDIPDSIKARLNQYRRLKIVGLANADKE
jgi:saccharopine dehydrogenase-like NADP-dependent oxidoreductase